MQVRFWVPGRRHDVPTDWRPFLCVAYSDLGGPGTMRSLSTLKTPGVEFACT